MLGDDPYDAEVKIMKQNLKRVQTENASLKKESSLYLSLSLLVGGLSCLMMIYIIFSSNPQINLIINDDEEYIAHEESFPIDDVQINTYKEIDNDIITSDLSVDEIEPISVEEEIFKSPPPRKQMSFGLPSKKDNKNDTFGLPERGEQSSSKVIRYKIIRYKVKKNDSLWKISVKHFGSSRYVKKIMKDNSLRSDQLEEGMRLILMIDR